jgi:glycosyltransferase involved in cell wall biosynthesis
VARAVKVLLVSFYFPPAGGAGVPRPLKFAELLAQVGVDVHVLAPDDPRWLYEDREIEIPDSIAVHRARYVGPRGRRPSEELHGLRGLDRLRRQLALTPRRLLLPDENVTWLATALPRALKIIRSEGIDIVLTTSPPGSIHLLGYLVQRATGVHWVADLRDSMLAKADRRFDRLAVRLKEQSGAQVARLIARRADAVVTVTETIAAEARSLGGRGSVYTIPNGCDFEDFEGLVYRPGERFRITHTGSFFGARTAEPFLEALARSDPAVVVRFVGDFRRAERERAEQQALGARIELHGHVSRRRSLEFQRDSEALLLLLPDAGERNKDVPSAKLYEYIAARRPILALVPSDGTAAAIVRETGVGLVAPPDDAVAIGKALDELVRQWRANPDVEPGLSEEWRERLSRNTRARELHAVLKELCDRPHQRARGGR